MMETSMLNWDTAAGNWMQFKGKVRARWGKLTDDHLAEIAGKRDLLLGIVQVAYGIDKANAEREIKEFETRNKDYV
jgi:uncharacterized protein YjbJ (UPF0337 family)